jgi:hypothetical protein
MSGRIGERLDDLQLLDDRAGPAVRDDQRQRILMRRLHVDEMDAQPVDLGHELRQRVQPRLTSAPVVFRRPVVREVPHRRELHALGLVIDRLPLGRPPRRDPPLEVGDRLLGDIDTKRPDGWIRGHGRSVGTHDRCPFCRAGKPDRQSAAPEALTRPARRPASPFPRHTGPLRPRRPLQTSRTA